MPTNAFVFPLSSRGAAIEALKDLILKGGCELVGSDYPAAEFDAAVDLADVVVILICPESDNDRTVADCVALANKKGKRVVGVWLDDKQTMMPDFLDEFGDGNVPMNAEKIARSICGGESIWETPTGEVRPTPITPRHKKR